MDSLPSFAHPAPLAGRVPTSPERHPTAAHRPRRAVPGPDVPELVGASRAMAELRQLIELVAPTGTTVLVTGETGTGKEVVARRIHASSERPDGPFVAVNCAALPESLIESELFGYERGAFTGAVGSRAGYFEEANGGTLFLDEVAELPLALQPKLLRAVQEREVRRLGASRSVRVDVRVVAATNVDLLRAIREGRFRADLYYRLCIIELHVPALRERKEDIPQLCEHFLRRCIPRTKSPLRRVSAAAEEAMDACSWPGNVRELENVIERALVLARLEDGDAILPRHLPAEMRAGLPAAEPAAGAGCALDLPGAVRRVRRHYVAEALRLSGGNKVEAARMLGISRRGLYDLLAEDARSG